jgi:3'-5' exoribonuclease
MWDRAEVLPEGVYTLSGDVQEYNGNLQVIIRQVAPRTSKVDTDFIKVSEYPVDDMWGVIVEAIVGMESKHIRTVVTDILFNQGYSDAFKTSPAAERMHHAFKSGLIEHTSQMVTVAKTLLELPFFKEVLNKDICLFGIIMHDFCKIFEYSQDGQYKPTIQGRLVPHIPMAGAMIYETSNKYGVPEIIRDHMMHVVLAHHGKLEWGSPVDMATLEAAFVHHVDHLHGDVMGWHQAISGSKLDVVKHGRQNLIGANFNSILKQVESNVIEKDIEL